MEIKKVVLTVVTLLLVTGCTASGQEAEINIAKLDTLADVMIGVQELPSYNTSYQIDAIEFIELMGELVDEVPTPEDL